MRERTETVMTGMPASLRRGSAPSRVSVQRKPIATCALAATRASAAARPPSSVQGSLTTVAVSFCAWIAKFAPVVISAPSVAKLSSMEYPGQFFCPIYPSPGHRQRKSSKIALFSIMLL